VSDVDRKLVSLIEELTDSGLVWPLAQVVGEWGRELPARVITDGFAVVRRGGDDLDDDSFLPIDDAVVVLHHLRKGDDYVIAEGPWGPICPEDEPELISLYAADEPKAVTEVRRRHAERRQAWEQKCR
jgi:hypothetical protein